MKDYDDLDEIERAVFNSRLLYAVKRFPTCYLMAQSMIELAEKFKVFDGVSHGTEEILNQKTKNAVLKHSSL